MDRLHDDEENVGRSQQAGVVERAQLTVSEQRLEVDVVVVVVGVVDVVATPGSNTLSLGPAGELSAL